MTPLHFAVSSAKSTPTGGSSHVDVISYLISNGANKNELMSQCSKQL